jgi:hypothetical protein
MEDMANDSPIPDRPRLEGLLGRDDEGSLDLGRVDEEELERERELVALTSTGSGKVGVGVALAEGRSIEFDGVGVAF